MKQCENSCDSCKYITRCGGCSLCEALICKNSCEKCNTICSNKDNVNQYLNRFGNLNIIANKNNYKNDIPFNIPVIPNRLSSPIKSKFIAAHAGSVLSNNGEKIVKRYLEKSFSDVLNIDPKTKIILEFYIKDKYLEGFWDNRYEIYKTLKSMNLQYIISPNFSVYEDAPRLDHMYNIKRSSIVYNEMLDIGLNAIPDISWFNKNDIDYWVNEINKNKIKLVAFSFQNVGVKLKPSNSWKHSLLGFRYFCSKVNSDVDIIIAGVASPFRILEMYDASEKNNKLIILNQSAYIQSRKGILSEIRRPAPSLTTDEILNRNIEYYDKIYKEIYNSNKLSNLSKLSKKYLIKLYGKLSLKAKTKEDEYILSFIFRCLKRKRVKEVILSQSQEVIQYLNKIQL